MSEQSKYVVTQERFALAEPITEPVKSNLILVENENGKNLQALFR